MITGEKVTRRPPKRSETRKPRGETKEKQNEAIKKQKMKDSKVYNEEKVSIDMSKLKVTDVKTCKRIKIPDPIEDEEEIKVERMRQIILEETKSYVKENCNKKGELKINAPGVNTQVKLKS